MGGRGVSSFFFFQHGKDTPPDALAPAVPETLNEALGARGAPMSVEEAATGANPGFSQEWRAYSENCQRAVVAYELRRRGYDVVALPTFEGDRLGESAYINENGVRKNRWMGALQGAAPTSVSAARNSTVSKNIESQMRSYGDGARAVVQVQWQGSSSGHVFNVENVGGSVRAVDAQTGKTTGSLKEALNGSKPGKTQLVRTDNLRVSERAKKSVTQKSKIYR